MEKKSKVLRLSKIKISEDFKSAKPNVGKFRDKYWFFSKHGKFQEPIVVNSHYELIDGYTTYLLAKAFGVEKLCVSIYK